MSNFNFSVQDLMSLDPKPFVAQQNKDLAKGKPLVTSSSYNQTKTFNPMVGASTLTIGEMLMGPTVFTKDSSYLTGPSSLLSSIVNGSTTPGTGTVSGGTAPSGGTATTGTSTATVSSSANASAKIAVVVQAAQSEIGQPYQWGGGNTQGPTLGSDDGHGQILGFDCSGLVLYCYDKAGLLLPRTAQEQWNATPHVSPTGPLTAGDLVFFGPSTSSIGHVGIMISSTNMIDAPQSGEFVRTESYKWTDLIAASRPFS